MFARTGDEASLELGEGSDWRQARGGSSLQTTNRPERSERWVRQH
jgi:hypothetical protein